MANMETEEFAKQWIEEGKPCIYRYGYSWYGDGGKEITKEEALMKLPSYSFCEGFFYNLSFTIWNGKEVMIFNELSADDVL